MKKYLFALVAVIGISFVSCTKDSVKPAVASNQPIMVRLQVVTDFGTSGYSQVIVVH